MCCSWSALSEYGRSLRTDLQWINVVNTLTLHAGDLRLFGNSRVNILFCNRCTASKCRLWPLVIIVSMNFTCTMVLFKCDTFLLISYIHEKIGNFYAKLFFFNFYQFIYISFYIYIYTYESQMCFWLGFVCFLGGGGVQSQTTLHYRLHHSDFYYFIDSEKSSCHDGLVALAYGLPRCLPATHTSFGKV